MEFMEGIALWLAEHINESLEETSRWETNKSMLAFIEETNGATFENSK